MRSALRLVAFAAVVAMLAAGIATADGLLEPGRADRAGTSLAPTVAEPAAGLQGDWYAVHRQRRAQGARSVRVTIVRPGLQLVSRPIPVVRGDCYRVEIELVARNDMRLQLRNETYTDVLFETAVIPEGRSEHVVTFRAPVSRLSVGISGGKGTTFTLSQTSIERLPVCSGGNQLDTASI
jgi:hypothetical protein